jgi:cystathionine gamma-synthase
MAEEMQHEFDTLLRSPLWRPRDLGKPLPGSPHANSACLPTWSDVIAYEQNDPRVLQRLQTGYPRFFIHPLVERFFVACAERLARGDEFCHAYPTLSSANRAVESVRRWSGVEGRIAAWREGGPFVVCLPRDVQKEARKHWRHAGEGISSRRAEAELSGSAEPPAREAKQAIRRQIAALTGASLEHVYLCSSGMNAIYTVHRATQRIRGPRPTVQFGFSYVDTLKIQQDLGPGVTFLPHGTDRELDQLEGLLAGEPRAAIFTEFPSNPLLASPNLRRLAQLAARHQVPLVVDETLGTYVNVDVLSAADVVVTSLTKYFHGAGDVMAGAVILNARSPLVQELHSALEAEYEDTLFGADALRLLQSSRGLPARMQQINGTAERLCEYLRAHPRVAEVYYPKYRDPENYAAFRRADGGFGGLFSLLLHDAQRNSQPFFDALRICKGPNLGTFFSLGCPFTLLAHFDELDFVERCGVSRYLVRISVGLEDADDLLERFAQALARLA